MAILSTIRRIHFDEDEHDALGENDPGPDRARGATTTLCGLLVRSRRRPFISRDGSSATFVADGVAIPPGLLEPLAAAMRVEGDVDVARGIELILRSRLFFSDWCRGKRVKGPVELAIGAIRACERFDPPPDFVELDGWLRAHGPAAVLPSERRGLARRPRLAARADHTCPRAASRRRSLAMLAGFARRERNTDSTSRFAGPIRWRRSSSATPRTIDHSRRRVDRRSLFARCFRCLKPSLLSCQSRTHLVVQAGCQYPSCRRRREIPGPGCGAGPCCCRCSGAAVLATGGRGRGAETGVADPGGHRAFRRQRRAEYGRSVLPMISTRRLARLANRAEDRAEAR